MRFTSIINSIKKSLEKINIRKFQEFLRIMRSKHRKKQHKVIKVQTDPSYNFKVTIAHNLSVIQISSIIFKYLHFDISFVSLGAIEP